MMGISAILFAAALLVALILYLSIGVKRVQRISGWILAPVGVVGIVLYTLGYVQGAQTLGEWVAAVVHAVYTTCLMFMGRNDYAALLRGAPWFADHVWVQALFWLAHLAALFALTSAILSTLGQKLLQTLRLRTARSRTVYLLFGLNEQSLSLGASLQKKGLTVYVDQKTTQERVAQAQERGGVVWQMPYTRDERALRRLFSYLGIGHLGSRQLTILALDPDETQNIRIVSDLVDLFTNMGVEGDRVRMYLRTQEELDYNLLRPLEDSGHARYNISVFSDEELSARLLIQKSPPCQSLTFDENGVAQGDFCAMIIGFGHVGQQTLRQLVMHGQFVGSKFKVVVVDRNVAQRAGQFVRRYAGMMEAYDIEFVEADTRSLRFFELLDDLAPRLSYIAVCFASDEDNYETTADLERFYTRTSHVDLPKIVVNVCNRRFVAKSQANIRFLHKQEQVYTSSVLLQEQSDLMAMAVNFSYIEYMGGDANAISAWREVSHFNRESSRASADFIGAMLRMAGLTEEEACDEARFAAYMKAHPVLFENLAIAEHLRWNAFHYAMGYTKMTLDEVRKRHDHGVLPLQKDNRRLLHACLTSWDELDELSALMAELTDNPTLDYKQMDRNNILNIPRTLTIESTLLAEEV